MRPALVVALALGAVALSGVAAWLVGDAVESSEQPAIPAMARDGTRLLGQSFPDPQGTPQALSQWRNKVLVVNFWATWCAPCREEMPDFSAMHAAMSAQGVQFVGIGIDSAEKIAEFQRATPVSYPLLVGNVTAIDLTRDYGNTLQALPFTVVIARDGRVAATRLGLYNSKDLRKVLDQLI